MTADERSVPAIGRSAGAAAVRHWMRLDADWKSVLVGLAVFTSIVYWNVPVPG